MSPLCSVGLFDPVVWVCVILYGGSIGLSLWTYVTLLCGSESLCYVGQCHSAMWVSVTVVWVSVIVV